MPAENRAFRSKLKSITASLPAPLRSRARKDIETLKPAGVSSLENLISSVMDERMSVDIRITACWVLGLLPAKRYVKPLLVAFNDPDAGLSWEAAKSLAHVGSKRALRPLIDTLSKAEDTNKRKAAAYALGLLRDERALKPLLNTLAQTNEDAGVRGYAAESLAHLKDRRAVRALLAALKDESTEVRFWSAYALGELRDKRALPELRRLAATDHSVLAGWWEVSKEASHAVEQILAD
jgi:HEAT repeat protein